MLVRPVQSLSFMMSEDTDLTMTCWCGRAICPEEKRCIFGVTWCVECFQRILRSCPRALRNAQRWLEDEEL
jgi:hypothetical protein